MIYLAFSLLGALIAFLVCAFLAGRAIRRVKSDKRLNEKLTEMVSKPLIEMIVENSAYFKQWDSSRPGGLIRIDGVDYQIVEIDHTANKLLLRRIGV